MEHPLFFALGSLLAVAAILMTIGLVSVLRPSLASGSPGWAAGCAAALGAVPILLVAAVSISLLATSFSGSFGR